MLPYRHGGAGRPLLTLGEMLEDLAGEEAKDLSPKDQPRPASSPEEGSSDAEKGPGSLEAQFERALDQVTSALRQPGSDWTDPTQKLCVSLSTANQLGNIAASELSKLNSQIDRAAQLVARSGTHLEHLKRIPLS